MILHEKYINRCLSLAKKGIGITRPNPSVGAVIVYQNEIIGEGFTSIYRGNHAEVNAVNSVKDKTLLQKSTLYVSLEPCVHFGKTPPCVDLILQYKIPKIVVGCVDSNEKVAGKGIEKLRKNGCEVWVGVLEEKCKNHHKRFFTFQNKKRPFVVLKWAESKDGFMAPKTQKERKPFWISNSKSRQYVHFLRAKEQAILVGTNTVSKDNPQLNVRDTGGFSPQIFVLDKSLRLSQKNQIFQQNIFIFTDISKKNKIQNTDKITYLFIDFEKEIAFQILNILYQKNIQSLFIEGGKQTLQTFINANLWDECFVFQGNKKMKTGLEAPKFYVKKSFQKTINEDILTQYKNEKYE